MQKQTEPAGILSFLKNLYFRPIRGTHTESEEETALFREKVAETNLTRLLLMAVIFVLLESFFVIITLAGLLRRPNEQEFLVVSSLGVCLSGLSSVVLFLALKRNTSRKMKTRIYQGCLFMYAVMMAVICMINLMDGNLMDISSLLNMSLLLLVCFLLPVLAFKEALCLTISVALVLSYYVSYTDKSRVLIVQIAAMCFIALAFSTVIYRNYKNNFISRLRLQESNQELQRMNKQLETLSQTDMLTSLLNRRGAKIQVEKLWKRNMEKGCSICVMLADIDFFKDYNDTFGHDNGDECLKLIAYCLTEKARRETDVISRHGGEEFMFVFEDITEEEAIGIARRIKDTVEHQKIPSASPKAASPYMTISFGIAIIMPDENNTFEAALKSADIALYRAKENGRNCVCAGDKFYR